MSTESTEQENKKSFCPNCGTINKVTQYHKEETDGKYTWYATYLEMSCSKCKKSFSIS